ncbi:MAG: ATP-binding protein [Bacteroidota bacterium]
MKKLEKTEDLIGQLQRFEVFKNIEAAPLQWLVKNSDYLLYEVGEHLFIPGKKPEHMQVIVQGKFEVKLSRNNETKTLGIWETGYVTGILPFSRMKEAAAFGTAIAPTYVLELHKSLYTKMVSVSYDMVQNLVGLMSDRIRTFSHQRYQNEKLMSLGKLSAGLAHELNNPASAMVRSADELYRQIHTTPEKFKAVITMRITPQQTDQVNAILFGKIKDWEPDSLSLLEREEQQDEILDWLEEHEVENGDDLAETFVEFGLGTEDLEKINDIINGQHLDTILWWIESTLNLERLVIEIRESSDRIAQLVGSIKNYSHMDRGVDFEWVDIHEGIINTVIILKHKIKRKNIILHKELDRTIPKLKAFPNELNQVWTNILDNAIDAMGPGGTLQIRTFEEREHICVQISDTGHGIPEEVIERIFDPFFTTKPIGEGTGLGLDIVHRIVDHHKGEIKVASKPGNTVFKLCFPIHQ